VISVEGMTAHEQGQGDKEGRKGMNNGDLVPRRPIGSASAPSRRALDRDAVLLSANCECRFGKWR
jgi:hypothetical protein